MAIYYLDVDDEVTSAAARIRDASDTRIALVLQGGARVATSRINFRLLAGEAKRRNKKLAIVTADATVQSVARSAGLPVFGTVGEYERAESARAHGTGPNSPDDVSEALGELGATVRVRPSGGNGRPGASRIAGTSLSSLIPQRFPWRVTAILGFVAAIALASGLFFFFPSATITLTVHEQQVGPVTFNATIDPNASAADDSGAVVPGLRKAFQVSTSGTFDATGQKITETPATGTVTFDSTNTLFAVPVVSGTQVWTSSGVYFATTQTVTVPVATTSGNYIRHGTASATVQAVQTGTNGNVAAGTISRLPSDLSTLKVSVTNPQPTTGGTHAVAQVVQQSDIDAATSALMADLSGQFQDQLGAADAAPSGTTLFPMTAKLGIGIISPDPQTYLGADTATFDLSASATGTAVVADMSTVGELAQSRVAKALDGGFTLVAGSIRSSFGTPVAQGDSVVVPVTATAGEARQLDESTLRAAIKGKSLDYARTYLAQFGLVQISVSPSWSSTLPAFDFRIDFHLVEEAASPAPSASPTPSPPAATARPTSAVHRTVAPTVVPSPSAEASPSPTGPAQTGEPLPSPVDSASPAG